MTQYVNPQAIDPFAGANQTHANVSFYDTPQEVIGRLQNRQVAQQLYQQAVMAGKQGLQKDEYDLAEKQREYELASNPEYQEMLRRSKMAGAQQVINSAQATDISNRNKVLSTAAQYMAATKDPMVKQQLLQMTRQQYPGFLPDDDNVAEQYLNMVQNSYQFNPEYLQKDALADQKYAMMQSQLEMKLAQANALAQMRIDAANARAAAGANRVSQPNTPFEYMITAFRRQYGRDPNLQELQQLQAGMPQYNPQVQGEKAGAITTAKTNAETKAKRDALNILRGGNTGQTSTVTPPTKPAAPVQKPNVIKLD